jgi:uncharacterized protein YbaR (Trm112 family)
MYLSFRLFLLSISILILTCGCTRQERVERIMEDGVKVVINHEEPYSVRGQPASLVLEKEISIDMERDDIAELGLPDVRGVNTDSEGNIYFFRYQRSENFIFKFDKNGNFLKSFGRMGQGHGEIQKVSYCSIDSKDNIIICDDANRKIIFFNTNGELSQEISYGSNMTEAVPLENGKCVVIRRITNPSKSISIKLILCSADFEEIKELDVFDQPPFSEGGKNKGQLRAFLFEWKITKDRIYIGNEQRGYEILVYDLEGNLLRKIRKEYEPLSLPENFRKEAEDYLLKNPNAKQWFNIPEEIPPYNSFFIDEEERLFVMTYEKGPSEGEYIHNVFNPDGVYFSRQSLNSYGKLGWSLEPLLAVTKNGRLYCLQEKESGYKELVVYRMKWE